MAILRTSRQKSGSVSWPFAVQGNSITFCSCMRTGTELEHPSSKQEAIMWLKDAAAGWGIVLFMVSAFVLASGASAFTV
jgi:hypothetical protein